MKNTFGNQIAVTLFGESHGKAIGVVIDGLAPGIKIDESYIEKKLDLRRPLGDISTPRKEADKFIIESGVYEGKTTGTPLCIIIENKDTHSSDYESIKGKARPGHSDFTGHMKYAGFEDPRGGGHFSGRITAALVAAGAIVQLALKDKGIIIGTHLCKLAGIRDENIEKIEDVTLLENKEFPALSKKAEEKMREEILKAKDEGDSVGGVLETYVMGMPPGIGEPWFDSVESMLSHGLFSIPAVKGVEFGRGFDIADLRGSQANDPYQIKEGKVVTTTNNNGGIGGGITNGETIVFRCAVKPTPSISKEQDTIDFIKNKNAKIKTHGRHDPCIAHRARAVVDAVAAITLADLLATHFGTNWLGEK